MTYALECFLMPIDWVYTRTKTDAGLPGMCILSFGRHCCFLTSSCCSVAKSRPTLCHPMDSSMPGFPVLHYLLKFAHTHVHWVSDAVHGQQYARLPCPSLSPEVCSHSCPLSQWCRPAISSFVTPFSSCLQSFPESGYLHTHQHSVRVPIFLFSCQQFSIAVLSILI